MQIKYLFLWTPNGHVKETYNISVAPVPISLNCLLFQRNNIPSPKQINLSILSRPISLLVLPTFAFNLISENMHHLIKIFEIINLSFSFSFSNVKCNWAFVQSLQSLVTQSGLAGSRILTPNVTDSSSTNWIRRR